MTTPKWSGSGGASRDHTGTSIRPRRCADPDRAHPTETKPRGFAIDPRGRDLLAVGETSNAMTGYAIDRQTGAPTPVCRAPMGKDPDRVEIIAPP